MERITNVKNDIACNKIHAKLCDKFSKTVSIILAKIDKVHEQTYAMITCKRFNRKTEKQLRAEFFSV